MKSSAPCRAPGPRARSEIGGAIYLAGNEGANSLVVLTEGFQSAFLALVVLAGIGLLPALTLLGSPRKRRGEEPNVSPPATAVTDNPN